MKKIYITLTLALVASVGFGQKKHVYYDTIKTIQTRVDYSPDTIPVYFKEIVIAHDSISEQWTSGYVIWQTYKKGNGLSILTGTTSGWITSSTNQPEYYKDDFEPTKFTDNVFLYADLKTKVKNRVLCTILK